MFEFVNLSLLFFFIFLSLTTKIVDATSPNMITLYIIIPKVSLSNSLKPYHLIIDTQKTRSTFEILSNKKTSLSYITAFENVSHKYLPYTVTGSIISNWLSKYRLYISQSTSGKTQSISNLFPSALSAEREIYDLLGILFQNSSDLRRILTDYGFKQHPLQKLVPSIGWKEISYSTAQLGIISKSLSN